MMKQNVNLFQRKKRISAIVASTVALVFLCAAILNIAFPLPEIYPDGPSVVVVASNGNVLRSFGDNHGVHRYQINSKDVDPFYIQALLYYEDQHFYQHPGFNIISLIRAGYQWASHGKIISGGSTLTMQVARLISPHSRTIKGKIQQLWRAMQLEWYFSKDEILTMYLNLAPFGGNIEGVEAASRHYFNKTASGLNKNEAALLVVLPQKPSIYRPDRYPLIAKKARNKILKRLINGKLLAKNEVELLCKEDVNLTRPEKRILAPLLSRYLKRKFPHTHVITTTVNFEIQSHLANLMSRTIQKLPRNGSGAVLVVDNKKGNVLAYQGSGDFLNLSRFGHVDMVRAVRSPGSTLKPFIYGLAFEQGIIHTESLLSDIPTSFSGYKPQNLNGKFSGAVSTSSALKKSLNVPAIQVLNSLTPEYFDQRLISAGIHLRHKKANLTIGLGGTGATLWELAQIYRSLAAAGKIRELTLTKDSVTPSDKILLSPQSSWMVFNILSSLSAPDRVVPSTRRKVAWKTGTSYGYRDFWSVGVSPDYTVAVWVGRPDATPLIGFLGSTLAAPLMFDVFDLLPRDKSTVGMPNGVEKKLICWPGGKDLKTTNSTSCISKKYAFTFQGITPPTIQSHGGFVTEDTWPDSLRLWQQQHKISIKKVDSPTELHIFGIRSGQHYFREQINTISLSTNLDSQPVRWYVNYKSIPNPMLKLEDYLGETTVTACLNGQCDSQKIYIH